MWNNQESLSLKYCLIRRAFWRPTALTTFSKEAASTDFTEPNACNNCSSVLGPIPGMERNSEDSIRFDR